MCHSSNPHPLPAPPLTAARSSHIQLCLHTRAICQYCTVLQKDIKATVSGGVACHAEQSVSTQHRITAARSSHTQPCPARPSHLPGWHCTRSKMSKLRCLEGVKKSYQHSQHPLTAAHSLHTQPCPAWPSHLPWWHCAPARCPSYDVWRGLKKATSIHSTPSLQHTHCIHSRVLHGRAICHGGTVLQRDVQATMSGGG